MIAVKVDQLFLSNVGFVVLLKGEEDERSLPIFIGAAEAQSIAIATNDLKIPRPLTHDLLKNILDQQECRLHRVEIRDIRNGTFYARLILERDTITMDMDSRPSDAIALALRAGAPIFVAEDVMNEAGQVLDPETLGISEDNPKVDGTLAVDTESTDIEEEGPADATASTHGLSPLNSFGANLIAP